MQGDHGKPRPAVVIQSDLYPTDETIVVLLLTSTLVDLPLGRVLVEPTEANGLRTVSQVMVDKPYAVALRKFGNVFGRLEEASMLEVGRRLVLFLGIAD